jgi:hypothetical protein
MPAESTYPHGEVFLDARGQGRALRLTWHHESDVVVLSLWREKVCAGTFRLSAADVNEFVDALVDGLRDLPADDALRTDVVVPHTGAIDLTTPAVAPLVEHTAAPRHVKVRSADAASSASAHADEPVETDVDDADGSDETGFVEWVLGRDGSRATA